MTNTQTDLAGIVNALRDVQRPVIVTHIHPDGDAIGSQLAMYYLLKGLGKEHVQCASEEGPPAIYQWMPNVDQLKHPQQLTAGWDAVVVVDVAQIDRIGGCKDLIHDGVRVIIVDHHLEKAPFGDVNFVNPTYAATGEILVELFETAGVELTAEAAQCAYVACTTDTGGFRFENTTPRSHRVAAKLLEKGISVAEISGLVFDTMPLTKFQLLKRILPRVVLDASGALAHTYVTKKDMAELGAKTEDIDGLITFARNIAGVRVALLFRESNDTTTKVSVRARAGFNAAEFLKQFGGGGHAGAAGATIDLPLESAREMVLTSLRTALEAHA